MVAKVPVDPILKKIREAAAKKLLDMYGSVVGYNRQSYTINVDSRGMPILDDAGQVSVTNTATGTKTVLPTENLVYQDPSHITYKDVKGATHVFDPSGGGSTPAPTPPHHGVMDYISTGSSVVGSVGQFKSGFGNKPVPQTNPVSGPRLPPESINLSNAWDLPSSNQALSNANGHFESVLRNSGVSFPEGMTYEDITRANGSTRLSPTEFGGQFRARLDQGIASERTDLSRSINNTQQQLDQSNRVLDRARADYRTESIDTQVNIERNRLDQALQNARNERIAHDTPTNNQTEQIAQSRLDEFNLNDHGRNQIISEAEERVNIAQINRDDVSNRLEALRNRDARLPTNAEIEARTASVSSAYEQIQQAKERQAAISGAWDANTNRERIFDQVNTLAGPGRDFVGPLQESPALPDSFRHGFQSAKIESGFGGIADADLTYDQRQIIAGRQAADNASFLERYHFTKDNWDNAEQELIDEGNLSPSPAQIAAREQENALNSPEKRQEALKIEKDFIGGLKKEIAIKAALAAGAAIGFEKSLESMWNWDANTTKWDKVKSSIGAFTTLGTMFGAMHSLHSSITSLANPTGIVGNLMSNRFTSALTSNGGIIATTVTLAFVSWLLRDKKSDEEIALEDLNETVAQTVSYDGPTMLLTGGLALVAMGINVGPGPSSLMQTMTVQQVALDKALGTQVENRYGTLFVQQGSGSEPTRVVYLTPGGVDADGNVLDTVHVATLGKGMSFGDPGKGAYIPFFLANGKENPQATACFQYQAAMVRCAISGKVSTMTGMQCQAQGGTCSHLAVPGS